MSESLEKVRSKGVELIVQGEHLGYALSEEDRTYVLGSLCELVGKSLQAAGQGRGEHAARLARALEGALIPMLETDEGHTLEHSLWEYEAALQELGQGGPH